MNDDEEARLRAAALRGARAKEILDNPLFMEACGLLKDAALRELVNVPITGTYDGEAEKLRLAAQIKVMLVEQFINILAVAIQGGKIGMYELDARTRPVQP